MEQLIVFFFLLFLGITVGKYNERRHFISLRNRERETLSIELNNLKKSYVPDDQILDQRLVIGATVISIDYFKLVVAGIKSIFGGKLNGFQSLIERGRREAVLRMKQDALDFNMIINVRIETSSISNDIGRRSVGSIEILAYGTALKLMKV